MSAAIRPLLFWIGDGDVGGARIIWRRGEDGRRNEKVTTRFTFNAVVYELRLRKTKWEESKKYGDRRYERLVRMDFESYNPKRDTTERFTLACGTEGEWKGVPVYVKYQPKWWFKAEGVIDESQVFD